MTLSMENMSPIELFRKYVNKNIRIIMRQEKEYNGVMKGFDEHGNVFLDNCEEIICDGCNITIGTAIINGGSVAMIDLI